MIKKHLVRLTRLACECEVMRVLSDHFEGKIHGDLFAWYRYYRENDPKFSEACAWLEHVAMKSYGTRKYGQAIKDCKLAFVRALDEDVSNLRQALDEKLKKGL